MAEMFLRAVPARANGVRTPATIATRRPLPNGAMAGTYSGIANRESGTGEYDSLLQRHNAGNVSFSDLIDDQAFDMFLNDQWRDQCRQLAGREEICRVSGAACAPALDHIQVCERERLVEQHASRNEYLCQC